MHKMLVPVVASTVGVAGAVLAQALRRLVRKQIPIRVTDIDGRCHRIDAAPGTSLLDAICKKDIFLEGACGGMCACSTCHVVLDEASYRRTGHPSEQENDMLDYAYALTPTSRLACQVMLDKRAQDLCVTIPRASRNLYVDGHRPEAH